MGTTRTPKPVLLTASKREKCTDKAFANLREGGVIPIIVNDVYKDHFARPERIQILYGGSGSGKSDWKATELLLKVMGQSYCRVVFSRKHKEQIRDSQFLLFKGLIARYQLGEFFNIKESEMDIECTVTGNLMLSAGLDDVDKLKSIPDITDFWIEEPLDRKGSIVFDDFLELNRRLRCEKASNHIHLTFNPVSRASWIYTRLFEEQNYDVFALKTTYRDNYFLPLNEVDQFEALKKVSPEQYAVYGLGEWGDPDSDLSLFKNDAISDMFTNSFVPRGGQRYLTADIAFEGKDKMVLAVWEGWVLIDLLSYPKTGAHQVIKNIEQVATRYSISGRRVCFDAAGAGGFLRDFLRTSIPFVGAGSALVVDGQASRLQTKLQQRKAYRNLRAQCYFYLSEKIENCETHFAVPNTGLQEQARKELLSIRKIEDKGDAPLQIIAKDQIKQMIGGSPDIADVLSMRAIFDLLPAYQQNAHKKRALSAYSR